MAKIKNWTKYSKDPIGDFYTKATFSQTSNSTKLPSGKIDYRAQNDYSLFVCDVLDMQRTLTRPPGQPQADPSAFRAYTASDIPLPEIDFSKVDNAALAKFNGKLRKGSASMGIDLVTWRQSREMLSHRLTQTSKTFDRAYSSLTRDKGRVKALRKHKEPLANQVLEYEFGWKPLFEDIHACMYTVCQNAIPAQWVGSRHKSVYVKSESSLSGPNSFWADFDGEISTRLVANVEISNPNLWLLNRLGLINPATILWDAIPWSFVVNMFLNVNAMITSFTDRVGLNVTNMSTTRSTHWKCKNGRSSRTGYPGPSTSLVKYVEKRRFAGSHPQPVWEVKVPELNWELAAIASSLLLQKAQRISNLIRLF